MAWLEAGAGRMLGMKDARKEGACEFTFGTNKELVISKVPQFSRDILRQAS